MHNLDKYVPPPRMKVGEQYQKNRPSVTNDYLSMIVLLQLRTEFQHTFMIKWEIKISTIAPHPTKNGVTSCPPLIEIYNRNRAATQIKRHTASKAAPSNYNSDVSTKVSC